MFRLIIVASKKEKIRPQKSHQNYEFFFRDTRSKVKEDEIVCLIFYIQTPLHWNKSVFVQSGTVMGRVMSFPRWIAVCITYIIPIYFVRDMHAVRKKSTDHQSFFSGFQPGCNFHFLKRLLMQNKTACNKICTVYIQFIFQGDPTGVHILSNQYSCFVRNSTVPEMSLRRMSLAMIYYSVFHSIPPV